MRGLIQFLLVIGGVALISAVLHKPLPSDALRRAQVERWPTEQERTRAADAPKLTTFTVAGPSGTPVAAVFYGLERLPRSEEGRLCDLVSSWIGSLPSDPARAIDTDKDDDATDLAGEIRSARPIICDQSRSATERLHAFAPVAGYLLFSDKTAGRRDIRHLGELAHLVIAALRDPDAPQESIRLALGQRYRFHAHDFGVAGLWFTRFANDLERLAVDWCDQTVVPACVTQALAAVARNYAVLGRQMNDEQHFKDAGDALQRAELRLKPLQAAPENHDQFATIASAYGYAGEAGRNAGFVRRAVQISEQVVASLEAEKDGSSASDYGHALSILGANLGRMAGHDVERRGWLEKAIAVHRQGIAHDARHLPEQASWTHHVNLASNAVELFSITREAEVIDEAILHARQALGLVKPGSATEAGDELDPAYARLRLGEALAWKSRHGPDLDEATRKVLAEEATRLIDDAEAVFRRANSQAYLRVIQRARPLLRDVLTRQ